MTLFDHLDPPADASTPADASPLPPLPPERRAFALGWLRRRLAVVCRFRAADLGREFGTATPADAGRLLAGRRDLAGFDCGPLVAEVFGGRPAGRFGGAAEG